MKLLLLLLLALISILPISEAQDLGVVWQRNDYATATSIFDNITKQDDGTYLACGHILSGGRSVGYIVHVNESGNKLKEWILTPPADRAEWNTGSPWAYLKHAYINTDGSIIAFGAVKNATVSPSSLLGHNLHGGGITNDFLQNGIWVTAFNYNTGATTVNKLDRGNSEIYGSIKHANNEYIILGYDYMSSTLRHFLFRKYNSSGVIIYDNYASGSHGDDLAWPTDIYRLPNNNYIITTRTQGAVEFNSTTNARVAQRFTALLNGQGCIAATPSGHHVATSTISMKPDGGFWATGRMSATSTDSYGWHFYERDAAGTLMECKVIIPGGSMATVQYEPPFLLPGVTNDYVGTMFNNGVRHIYLCVDNPSGGFTLTTGPAIPYNTRIKVSSHTDGFFSAGQDPSTNRAALAKLSTCANFISTNATDINLPRNTMGGSTVNVKYKRELNYTGALGDNSATDKKVRYMLQARVIQGTVNGQPAGTYLHNITSWQDVETHASDGAGKYRGTGVTIDEDYTFSHDAVIEYTYSIMDRYYTAITTPQTCSQTYVFYAQLSDGGSAVNPIDYACDGIIPSTSIPTSGVAAGTTYSWRYLLTSGSLSSHPAATVGSVIASGTGATISSLNVTGPTSTMIQLEVIATQTVSGVTSSTTSARSFEVRKSTTPDMIKITIN